MRFLIYSTQPIIDLDIVSHITCEWDTDTRYILFNFNKKNCDSPYTGCKWFFDSDEERDLVFEKLQQAIPTSLCIYI